MRRRFMNGIKGIQGWISPRIGFNRQCERKRSNPTHHEKKEWIASLTLAMTKGEMDAHHHPRTRNRFRRLAQGRADAGAERREAVRRDMDGARPNARTTSAR